MLTLSLFVLQSFAGSLVLHADTSPGEAIASVELATREALTDVRVASLPQLATPTVSCTGPVDTPSTIATQRKRLLRVDFEGAMKAATEWDAALACADRALDPAKASKVWFLAGYAAFEEGQVDRAREAYARASQLDPTITWDETYRMEGVPLFFEGQKQVLQAGRTRVRVFPAPGRLRIDGRLVDVTDEHAEIGPGPTVIQSEGGETLLVVDPGVIDPEQPLVLGGLLDRPTLIGLVQSQRWDVLRSLTEPALREGETLHLVVGRTVYEQGADGSFKLLSSTRERVPRALTWAGLGLAVGGAGYAGLEYGLAQPDRRAFQEAQGIDESAFTEASTAYDKHRQREPIGWAVAGVGVGVAVLGQALRWRARRQLGIGVHPLPQGGAGIRLGGRW